MFCSLCEGPLYVLGWLGKFLYTRCRNCGAECRREDDNNDEEGVC